MPLGARLGRVRLPALAAVARLLVARNSTEGGHSFKSGAPDSAPKPAAPLLIRSLLCAAYLA